MVLSEDSVSGYLIYKRAIEAMFSQQTDHRGCLGVTLSLSVDCIPNNPQISTSNTQKWYVKCNNQLTSFRYPPKKVNNGYWAFIDNVYQAPLCTKYQTLWRLKKKEESIITDNENVSSLKGRQFTSENILGMKTTDWTRNELHECRGVTGWVMGAQSEWVDVGI
jgi:hypothetical protein